MGTGEAGLAEALSFSQASLTGCAVNKNAAWNIQRGHCSPAITQPRATAARRDFTAAARVWSGREIDGGRGGCFCVCTHRCLFVLIFAVFTQWMCASFVCCCDRQVFFFF